jgi:hypothetical protein
MLKLPLGLCLGVMLAACEQTPVGEKSSSRTPLEGSKVFAFAGSLGELPWIEESNREFYCYRWTIYPSGNPATMIGCKENEGSPAIPDSATLSDTVYDVKGHYALKWSEPAVDSGWIVEGGFPSSPNEIDFRFSLHWTRKIHTTSAAYSLPEESTYEKQKSRNDAKPFKVVLTSKTAFLSPTSH